MIQKATDQWNREIPIIASRGKIVDCNGEVLVDNRATYSIFARPNSVYDKKETASALSKLLQIDEQELLDKLQKKVSEVTIAKQVEKEIIDSMVALDLSGVYYSSDNKRSYAYDDLLCQVLGFISSDGNGVSGLEKFYNTVLSGENGEILYATDIVGKETGQSVAIYKEAINGNVISLTIDLSIQLAVEEIIKKAYDETKAKGVSCIVMDPNTFEILALCNYPSYNLNDIPRNDIEKLNMLSRNRLICDIYEPGSTFKVITAAANIEEFLRGNTKAFSTKYIFNSSRIRAVDSTTIKCWADHKNGKHSNQTLADALNNSCNPCFTDIAISLGSAKFYEYLEKFGFGKVTGVDFSGEALGMLIPKNALRLCDLARIGFGQTIAVTAIQLICAIASAVNGGVYYQPHILKDIRSSDGKIVGESENIVKKQVISKEASNILAKMLEGVVAEGSGKKAYIEGFEVGGKTGTAQKYENGKIAAGKYISSFCGFFPASSPKYIALIIVDEPVGTYYGSAIAAPLAGEIFQDIIQIKNMKPIGSVL